MLVLLALSAGFGEFPKVAPELELPGRMTYSGTTSSTCDPFKEDWRYAYVSGAEMNLAGVDYGQKVTRVQCFDACGSAPACKQAVCYSAGVSVWEADTPCHCYPMNTARTHDSDGKGGSNTGFASIHCNDGRLMAENTQLKSDKELLVAELLFIGRAGHLAGHLYQQLLTAEVEEIIEFVNRNLEYHC